MRSFVQSLQRSDAAQPASVALARHGLGDFAGRAGAARGVLDRIASATSEAVTNAVRHAYSAEPGRST